MRLPPGGEAGCTCPQANAHFTLQSGVRIFEQTTVAYRRLPGPLVFLAALVLIPVGLVLGLAILIPAILIMLAVWLWAAASRLLTRGMAAARFDTAGRRNVRVVHRQQADSIEQ